MPELIDGEPREEYIQRLQWLLFLRVIISTFLLGSTLLLHIQEQFAYLNTFNALIGVNVLFSFLSLFFVNRIVQLRYFALWQVVWDVVFISLLVFISQGAENFFPFLYFLTIFNSSVVLGRGGAYLTALLSMLLYGGVLWGGRIWFGEGEGEVGLTTYLIYGSAFFLVASIGSFISDQLRKTGRALAEQKLNFLWLKALHENIVESVNMGLVTIDRSGRITFFNQSAVTITGIPIERAHHRSIEEVFPGIPLPETNQEEAPPRNHRFEFEFLREGSTPVPLGCTITALKDTEGIVIGKIMTFQDLTEFKRMEEQIRRADKLAAIGKLAAGIAHEIRNPLASISGSIQMLKNDIGLSPLQEQLMEIVLRETDRLNTLLTEFLLFARPWRNTMERVNLEWLIGETIEVFTKNPDFDRHYEIDAHVEENLYVNGDPERLKQVFWNLLNNALEAMPGAGRVTIETARLPERGEVRIDIRDDGIGIDPETLEKIFDPFFTTKESGTGLGLALAYRIIESH
ncbi:MAG: PAS domain-containing protein, partial [Deltaproteobacteria bacterium]